MTGTDEHHELGGDKATEDPAAATRDPRARPPRPAPRTGPRRPDDPAAIAADIERTREELAETLDAIVDKVSPKRVARRTGQKVAETVKDGAREARERVLEQAEAVRSRAAAPAPAPADSTPALPSAEGVTVGDLPTSSYAVPLGGAQDAGPTYSVARRGITPEAVAVAAIAALFAWLVVSSRRR